MYLQSRPWGSCHPACCRGYNGQIEDALVVVAGKEAIGVACVVVGVWDLDGFEVRVGFNVGVVRVKFGQSIVWVPPSIKQIGHHCEDDPCPIIARA